ncbi:alpha-1,2-fucosyltransferase [Prosthecobacter sp.]|uniref:alpha-1,2-fucosyltransferase n=1 Tax=Prosthecobacter sp. TaxID=1965333 RepID=UPI003784C992
MNTILVNLSGGLGNQMFQYAAARHLAELNDAELLLDVSGFDTYKLRTYALGHLNIQARTASALEVAQMTGKGSFLNKLLAKTVFRGSRLERVPQEGLRYDPGLLARRGSLFLDGYWQSPRYFRDIAPQIKSEFQVKTPPSAANAAMGAQISGCNSVSLHVRRTDYVSNANTHGVHGSCSLQYYDQAAAELGARETGLRFFIFSDDIPWARENLAFPGEKVFIDFNDADHHYEDLRLMSLCRHHVTANSTFSWWGAWLGAEDGITLTPARWFNDESKGPPVDDLIPEGWIRIGGDA